jgi:hypothetical protein
MAKATLPTPESNPGKAEWSEVFANDRALREAVNSVANEQLAGGIEGGKLAANAKPFVWYTPKIIATEESRESTSFGTLTTPDEITGVVLPENGLIALGWSAKVKQSVAAAGKFAIFLGTNQLKGIINGSPAALEGGVIGTAGFNHCFSNSIGITAATENAGADVATGQILGNSLNNTGGLCYIHAAAGTYNIRIQFKATSGTIKAKERKLWVGTLGY